MEYRLILYGDVSESGVTCNATPSFDVERSLPSKGALETIDFSCVEVSFIPTISPTNSATLNVVQAESSTTTDVPLLVSLLLH